MTITYTVSEVVDNVATVEFTDSETGLSAKKSVSFGDIIGDTDAIKLRIEQHQATFEHRLSLGHIKPPVEINPTEETPVEEAVSKKTKAK